MHAFFQQQKIVGNNIKGLKELGVYLEGVEDVGEDLENLEDTSNTWGAAPAPASAQARPEHSLSKLFQTVLKLSICFCFVLKV